MKLFEPFPIRGMTLPNRIVLPAMVTRLSGEDGEVNGDIVDRYVRYAKGGPGLIVIEAMAVHEAKSGPLLRLSHDRYLQGHRRLIAAMRAAGPSRIVPQIIHFLKIARSGWRQKVADLALDEIRGIVAAYGESAERARRAGYDGVELHMAHAYTLSSFLSGHNGRRDDYGGTLENRLRLPSEVLVEVRRRVGPDFPIGIRFDAEECIVGGYGLIESREIALRFARLGADYLSISAGGKFEDAVHRPGEPLYPYTGYSGDRCMPGREYQDGYNSYLSAGIRAHLREQGCSKPVVTTGKIRTRDLAERLLADGTADLIGMARTLLADPDWPNKVREGREDRVVRCLSINVCKSLDEKFRKVRCYLWPKGALHAPESNDRTAPRWEGGRAGLRVVEDPPGHVRLSWTPAVDPEGMYGYLVERAVGDGGWEFLTAIRADMHSAWQDGSAVSGARLRYRLRPYDLGGNRGEASEEVEIRLPWPARNP